MKSLLNRRVVLIALSVLAVLALVALAADLREVRFKEPRLLSHMQSESIQVSVRDLFEQIAAVPLWKLIVFWGIILLIVLILASLLSSELRKRILRSFIRLALFSIAILFLMKYGDRFGLFDAQMPPASEAQQSTTTENVPPPVFTPPTIPPVATYLITVAVILGTAGMFWLLGRGLANMRVRPTEGPSLEEIAAAARRSLDELSGGADWEDAIVRCYARMAQTVARSRGLLREDSVTPAEFAYRLELAGLPADPIHRLTRLFESVRYGARSTGTRESDEAVACLTDILHACGEAA